MKRISRKFSFFNFLRKKRKKIGLALGGGAVRGIAHIGVIKVLEENNIPIDCIAGVSSGSLVGGIYASGTSIDYMIENISEVNWPDIGNLAVSTKGIFSSERIEGFVKKHSKTNNLSKMKIPFCSIAVDLLTGKEEVFKRGELSKAIRASISFPGIYVPFEFNGRHYVDGCIFNILPAMALKDMGADFVIGIDVIPQKVNLSEIPENSFYIIDRCIDLVFEKIPRESKYKGVDVLIQPIVGEEISSIDLYERKKLIHLGKEAAERKIDIIKSELGIL